MGARDLEGGDQGEVRGMLGTNKPVCKMEASHATLSHCTDWRRVCSMRPAETQVCTHGIEVSTRCVNGIKARLF